MTRPSGRAEPRYRVETRRTRTRMVSVGTVLNDRSACGYAGSQGHKGCWQEDKVTTGVCSAVQWCERRGGDRSARGSTKVEPYVKSSISQGATLVAHGAGRIS